VEAENVDSNISTRIVQYQILGIRVDSIYSFIRNQTY
jgi:hypothetical protein